MFRVKLSSSGRLMLTSAPYRRLFGISTFIAFITFSPLVYQVFFCFFFFCFWILCTWTWIGGEITWSRHQYRRRAANFDVKSALIWFIMFIGFLSVPLLRHGAYICKGHLRVFCCQVVGSDSVSSCFNECLGPADMHRWVLGQSSRKLRSFNNLKMKYVKSNWIFWIFSSYGEGA